MRYFEVLVLMFFALCAYSQYKKQGDISNMKTRVDDVGKMLDDLRGLLRNVKDELQRAENELGDIKKDVAMQRKDKTGLVDYAYGGKVVSIGNTETLSGDEGLTLIGFKICGEDNLERRILESSVMPGNCWPFKGQRGFAVIELIQPIVVRKITLEHSPAELLSDTAKSSAPKIISLWGQHEDAKGPSHFFGEFTVHWQADLEVQTFHVTHPSENPFISVKFMVLSNHGHTKYTCVYRVRVHGDPILHSYAES